MCGIAGVISLKGPLEGTARESLGSMLAVLGHRGPDSAAIDGDAGCLLGNTRLAVTDPGERAGLPMRDPLSRTLLAFNGAVTDHRERRKRLELSGPPLGTGSDAEVVLRLYRAQGAGFLEGLGGMFALALHDPAAGKVLLARDAFGQRPLFYRVKRGRVHFASELKAFLELPDFDAALDAQALSDYLTLAYIPGSRTPFAEVRELGPGRLLEVGLARGTAAERPFFRPDYRVDASIGEPEAAAGVRRRVEASVERCLDVDVPAGLTLSGGVDTGMLLGVAKRLGRARRTHTFSLRVADASFDEGPYQRALVEFARPIHHEVAVTPERVLAALERHMAFLDEPSGDGAAIPMFLLAEEASKHVRVLLSGEGGDEVFLAYETHRAYNARRLYRACVPAGLRRLVRGAADLLPVSHDKLSLDFLAKRFTRGAELGVPEAHVFWRHALPDADKAALMPGSRALRPATAPFRELYDGTEGSELSRLAWLDLELYLVGDLMTKNDRMLMAHSVEGRFPYLDRDLFAYAARLPDRYKLRGMNGRIVQKAAARGLVPDSVLARSNMGLELPYSRWFLGPFREAAEARFTRASLGKSGLLDPDAARALWEEHLSGRRDNGRALWSLLTFLVWFDLFVADKDYKRHWRPKSYNPPSLRCGTQVV